jgi:pilus assembly protein CpaE
MGLRHPLTVGIAIASDSLRDDVHIPLRNLGARILLEQATPVETLQLKRLNLDLLLIDAIPVGESLEDLVHRVKVVSPSTTVAVLHRSPDPEVMLRAMRAGTDEFILPPLEERLTAAVDRIAAQIAKRETSSRPTGKVVGIVSAKGGCGATTVACHVATEFQRATQHDVLLADFDLESGMLAFLLQAQPHYTILDALKNAYRLDQSYWKGLVANIAPSLDLIASPCGAPPLNDEQVRSLREVFRLVRSMYSWIIADLGRTLNTVTAALLDDLDEIFLVTTPSIASLYQAKQYIQRMNNAGYSRDQLHMVLNRVPRRSDFHPDDIQRSLGIPVYAELADRPEIEQAYTAGKLMPADSDLGKQFTALTLKMAGVQAEKSKGWGSLFGAKKVQPGYQGVSS